MISKERLRELLEERAIIYRVNDCVCELHLNEDDFAVTDKQLVFNYKFHKDLFFEDLFETEDEAREYLKYGNVVRTEKLELPMWKDVEEAIEKAGNGTYIVAKNKDFSLSVEVNTPVVSVISLFTATEYYNWNYNKENYYTALDFAIRLWKGEEW